MKSFHATAESAAPPPVRSGFLPERIVHLHPTRLCNLACLHCYSESDPQQATALDADTVCSALTLLRAEGYALLSLSGGEPLVYPPLRDVVRFAKGLGFRVTMISNGLLVNPRHDVLLNLLDGVAISFDGLEATHNHWRGRADAFKRACAAVRHLTEQGIHVAAAISLTRDAMTELPDLADLLVELGATALQIRPVARAGRARSLTESVFYSPTDQLRLHLVARALQQELPGVRVHCDLAPAQGLWQQRDAYAGLLGGCGEQDGQDGRAPGVVPHSQRPLADLINPLVITETGALKPVAYDFDRRFDLGNIEGLSAEALTRYKHQGLPAFRALMGSALAGLQGQQRVLDWFDHCTRLSERQGRIPINATVD